MSPGLSAATKAGAADDAEQQPDHRGERGPSDGASAGTPSGKESLHLEVAHGRAGVEILATAWANEG